MQDYEGKIDLDKLIGDIEPNLVTPRLDEIVALPNSKRPKQLAEIIITGMVDAVTDPVNKEIVHDGDIHHIRFVNIEPLLEGHWATISLLLLTLSYGEQSTIIEAIYPARLQLHAKAFAVVFTPDMKSKTVTIKQDDELIDKVDSANAGIAMIIALLKKTGFVPHADEINKNQDAMESLVETMRERDKYQKKHNKAQSAAKSRDGGMSR